MSSTKRHKVSIYWRDSTDEQSSSHWSDVVSYRYEGDVLWLQMPTGHEHRVNLKATQQVTIAGVYE